MELLAQAKASGLRPHRRPGADPRGGQRSRRPRGRIAIARLRLPRGGAAARRRRLRDRAAAGRKAGPRLGHVDAGAGRLREAETKTDGAAAPVPEVETKSSATIAAADPEADTKDTTIEAAGAKKGQEAAH